MHLSDTPDPLADAASDFAIVTDQREIGAPTPRPSETAAMS